MATRRFRRRRSGRSRRLPLFLALAAVIGLTAWYVAAPREAPEVRTMAADPRPAALVRPQPKPVVIAVAAPQPEAAPEPAAPLPPPAAPLQLQAAAPPPPAAPPAAIPVAVPAPTPVPTPLAAAAASAPAAPPADAEGDAGKALAEIQRLLTRVGYEPGAADGQMRADTGRAIRLFQLDMGLKMDGQPSKGLLAFLRKLAGKH